MKGVTVEINGKQYPNVNPDGLEEIYKKYPGVRVVAPDDLPANPTTLGPAAQYVQGAGRMGAQGLTLGHADEAEAWLDSVTGGDPYDKGVEDIRSSNVAFRKEHPVTAYGMEFAGGMAVPGGALVKAAKHVPKLKIGAHALRPAGALAIAGGSEGMVAGAGYSEAPAGSSDFNRDVAVGGAAGTVLAPAGGWALQKAGQVLSSAGRMVKNRFLGSDYDEAVKIVRKAIQNDEISPGEGDELIRQFGGEGVLADAGPNLRETGRVVATRASPGKKPAQDMLMQRQSGSQERIKGLAQEYIDPKWDNYHQFLGATKAARKAQAGPLYDAAYERVLTPADVSPEFNNLWNKPSVKKAFKKAQKTIADELDSPVTGLQAGGEGSVSVQLLDQTKRELDNMIAKAGYGTPRARQLVKLKKAFVKEIDAAVPEYGQARAVFAGGKQLDDAAEMGADLLKGTKHIDDLEGIISDFTEGEMDAFRVGAMKGIFNKIDTGDITHDSVKKLMGSTRVKKLLRSAFKNEEDFVGFMEGAAHEGNMTRTFNYSTQGRQSATAATQQEERAMQGMLGIGQDLTRSGGSVGHALSRVAEKLFSKDELTEGVLNEMSKILFDRNLSSDQLNRIIGTRTMGALRTPTGAAAHAVTGGLMPAMAGETSTQKRRGALSQ